MGTDKRERKKANRELRREEERRAEQRSRSRRKIIRIGIIVIIAAAFLVAIALIFGGGDDDATPPTTLAPVTTVAPETTPAPTPDTVPGREITGETPCPEADGSSARAISFEQAPPDCLEPGATYEAEITTNVGAFTVALDPDRAPATVNNFVVLARYGYFDGTVCHRAIPGFVVQCGDPTATGTGGPGYTFPDELPETGEYQIGSLAMANSGPDTNGSQFFVITGDNGAALPPNYSLFGEVIGGLDTTVVEMDALGNPASNGVPPLGEIRIESVRITQS